jgi:acyl dehydratase
MAHVGESLGPSSWTTIDRERLDRFAEASGERVEDAVWGQWGVAPGYLTLSLVNLFLPELVVVERFSMGVNVGVDKVRFPNPVPVGSRIRARGEITSATGVGEGVQAVVRVTIEVDGEEKPACVVDTVSRFFP